MSITPFLLVNSRALLAASRALAASYAFATIFLASVGCSSNHWFKDSETNCSTTGRTSLDTNLSFV